MPMGDDVFRVHTGLLKGCIRILKGSMSIDAENPDLLKDVQKEIRIRL